MKYVYLVRHGESEANAGTGTVRDSALTAKGREQAEIIAERCSRLPVEVIIASTLLRAQETGRAVQAKLKKPLESSDLFIERRPPTECLDMNEKDWMVVQKEIDKNFTVPGFHQSDEENFEDLNERARKALALLAARKEDHIAVITHGTFMRLLFGRAVFGDAFNADMCVHLIRGLRTRNTGLTMLRYNEEIADWKVFAWNDHAHLG